MTSTINFFITMTTAFKIKNLKNFAYLDKSFKEWLTTCPRDYIWQIDEVTKDNEGDYEGTFTFRRTLTYKRRTNGL